MTKDIIFLDNNNSKIVSRFQIKNVHLSGDKRKDTIIDEKFREHKIILLLYFNTFTRLTK